MKFKVVLLLLFVSFPSLAIPTRYIVEGSYENYAPSVHLSFPDKGTLTGWFDFDPDKSISSLSDEGKIFAAGAFVFNFYIHETLLHSDSTYYHYAQGTEPTLESIRDIEGYRVDFSPWTSTPFIKPEVLFFNYHPSTETISIQLNAVPCCTDRYYALFATANITTSYALVSEPKLHALLGLFILILLAKRARSMNTNPKPEIMR